MIDKYKIKSVRKNHFYSLYCAMKQRCRGKDKIHKKYYKDRGIGVCKRWSKYENFMEDMLVGYLDYINKFGKDSVSLDRIDSNKGYYKENCRWVSMKEQNRNSSRCHYLEFNNEVRCMTEWAEKMNLTRSVIKARLKRGWSLEKTLLTPIRKCKRK